MIKETISKLQVKFPKFQDFHFMNNQAFMEK